MGDLTDLLSGSAGSLGFGGMAGVIVGYTAKKLTKLTAILLALVFILIQVLSYQGWIEVEWTAVEESAKGVWVDDTGVTLADRAWTILTANRPFGGAFIAGFALCFKLG
jgi:uncharacterized membrane protein (Fun14 family)